MRAALLVLIAATAHGKEPPVTAFAAARDRFVHLAQTVTGRPAKALNLYPQTPGDHWDRKEFAALQTGELFAWQATGDRRILLRAFVGSEGAEVFLSDDLVRRIHRAAAGGTPVAEDHPGLARLASAIAGPAALETRLRFLFHFGKWEKVCPVRVDGPRTTWRWQLSILAPGSEDPGGAEMLPDDRIWLTLTLEGAGAHLMSGAEGCGG